MREFPFSHFFFPSLEHRIGKVIFTGVFGVHHKHINCDLLLALLRGSGVETVVIIGTTTENCCHATARDAMFRDYFVVFVADATGTFDYPDVGWGAMSAAEVHAATLSILAFSTADVTTVADLEKRVDAAEAPREALES